MMQDYEIINADCLRAMQEMPDGYVDAIVTDPPYGLAFMGANWDHNVPSVSYWSECLRVAKSGAHLLCFGGTRTFHRLMCAIEDAGWEIRDTIMWVYGSGFPKSLDVGKAIDKALGAKREQVRIPASEVRNPKVINSGHGIDGGDRPWMKKALEVGYHEKDSDVPVTDQAKEWDGWGTCLKPAWEPIIVARKPLDGTVVHNVMTHGTGAINIDGCRVPINGERLSYGTFHSGGENGLNGTSTFRIRERHYPEGYQPEGRFPANLVHDGSQEVLELIGDAQRFFYCAKASKRDRGEGNNHPTVKPNALMRWLVRLVCPQGGIVLDPFMGSGSTGVACIQEGMQFFGIDMDEHYCEIANTRISKEADTVFCENQ